VRGRRHHPEQAEQVEPEKGTADWHANRAELLASVAAPLGTTGDRQVAASLAVYHALVALRLDYGHAEHELVTGPVAWPGDPEDGLP
jgi:hypothetical protein